MRERRELRRLRDDLPRIAMLVPFRFQNIDLGRTTSDGDVWARVVGTGT